MKLTGQSLASLVIALSSAASGWMLSEWWHAGDAPTEAASSIQGEPPSGRASAAPASPPRPEETRPASPQPALAKTDPPPARPEEVLCASTATKADSDAQARLLSAISEGDEAARYDGLIKARSEGLVVPDHVLKTLFENDQSDRVRLLAFENYLEPRSSDYEEMRKSLQAALDVPSAALRADVEQRLAAIARLEADAAANPQVTQ